MNRLRQLLINLHRTNLDKSELIIRFANWIDSAMLGINTVSAQAISHEIFMLRLQLNDNDSLLDEIEEICGVEEEVDTMHTDIEYLKTSMSSLIRSRNRTE